ncbi:MAG: hypothetical protein WCB74_19635, partial [Pseudolabrys sp.]
MDIDSVSADGACRVAVPVLVRVYAFVADRTPRPAVAVIISADVLTANRASRIAVLISVGVYGAIAVNACRITRSIRVKAAALGVQRKNGYRQHYRCKGEARHGTPVLLLVADGCRSYRVTLTLPHSRIFKVPEPGRGATSVNRCFTPPLLGLAPHRRRLRVLELSRATLFEPKRANVAAPGLGANHQPAILQHGIV